MQVCVCVWGGGGGVFFFSIYFFFHVVIMHCVCMPDHAEECAQVQETPYLMRR